MQVGVLALQGDFYLHKKMLTELGVEVVEVRKPSDLEACQGLIIPGGESTTLVKLLKNIDLFDKLPDFNKRAPIFGTCAGCILVSAEVMNRPVESLNLIDITTERNAYGRQIDSFVDKVTLHLNHEKVKTEGVFIRAPKISRVGESVKILGTHQKEIVLVENEKVLAATFHPELSGDTRIHRYFLEKITPGI